MKKLFARPVCDEINRVGERKRECVCERDRDRERERERERESEQSEGMRPTPRLKFRKELHAFQS
jgi:hypothetical protein